MREGGKRGGRKEKKLEIGHDEIIYTTNPDKLQIRVLSFQGLIIPINHWNQRSDPNSEELQGDCEHSRNMICYLFYPSVKEQSSTMWRIDYILDTVTTGPALKAVVKFRLEMEGPGLAQ